MNHLYASFLTKASHIWNQKTNGVTATKPQRTSLFASYSSSRVNVQQSSVSLSALINNYLDAVVTCRVCKWEDVEREGFSRLKPLLEKLFSITATSAPVERVFSHSGLFIRPHRARMSDSTLSALVYVKCNKHIVWLTDWLIVMNDTINECYWVK